MIEKPLISLEEIFNQKTVVEMFGENSHVTKNEKLEKTEAEENQGNFKIPKSGKMEEERIPVEEDELIMKLTKQLEEMRLMKKRKIQKAKEKKSKKMVKKKLLSMFNEMIDELIEEEDEEESFEI